MTKGRSSPWACASALATLAALVSVLVSACSIGPIEEAEGGEHSAALGTSEPGCSDWTQVEQTLTRGGEFASPATYNPSGCALGYRLNLIDYDGRKYNQGAVVGWGGAIPSTEAACTGSFVRAYVWLRNSNGSMTFVDNKSRNGRWVIGHDNVGRCRPPTVHLERDVGIVPNGARDYRVAMTARTGANVTVPVVFATVEDHFASPLDDVSNLRAYSAKLAQHSGSNLEPFLAAFWAQRATPAGRLICRRLDIDRGLHAFTRAAFIKAGATTSTVDARITALNNLRAALCDAGGSATNLHTAMNAYVTQTLNVRDQLDADLLALMPASYEATRAPMVANMMSQITHQAIGSLISKCDLDAAPLSRFMSHGLLPTGLTDPTRLVLGACASQAPAQAASSIGFGTATPGVSNPISAMASCMAGLASDVTEDRCSNPRTQGAPEAPPSTDEEEDIPCINARTGQACSPQLADKQAALESAVASERQKAEAVAVEAVVQTTTYQPQASKAAIIQTLVAVSVAADMAATIAMGSSIAAGPGAPAVLATAVAAKAVYWTTSLMVGVYAEELMDWYAPDEDSPIPAPSQDDLRQWCESSPSGSAFCDEFDAQGQYCPADPVMQAYGLTRSLGTGWFETGGPKGKHQATKQDLFNHCLCNLVDTDYAIASRGDAPSRAPAVSCPQSEEQRKLECVADPRMRIGDDDRPDFDCIRLLAPGPDDPNTWRVRDCTKKTCPANQKPFAKDDGQCVCETVIPVNAKFPNCAVTPRASSGICTQDNAAPCFCEPLAPLPPNGGDPFCRQNPNVLPGPLWSWMKPDTDALYLDTFNATTDLLRVRAGGNTQFVSPTYYPNTFATRGTSIRHKVVLFKAPNQSLGENVDLKLYYTNRTKNVFRSFLGQCRMNSFAVGSLSNCDFPLPTVNNVNAGTLEDPFELEVELNTASTYTSRPGLGPVSFTGTLSTTPAAKLAPNCPAPTPANGLDILTIRNPLPGILNVDLVPNPQYSLPDGSRVAIPYGRPVIRELQ